ncbi:Fic family protein [bacterium]|nr:Fic family protein [bacterium]
MFAESGKLSLSRQANQQKLIKNNLRIDRKFHFRPFKCNSLFLIALKCTNLNLMRKEDFIDPSTGHLVPTIRDCWAFVPKPLPPVRLDLAPLLPLVEQSARMLGELSGIGRNLQNPYLLIRPLMRNEAVASSKIEGTVTTLSELFLFEAEASNKTPVSDAREVYNYVHALEYALKSLETFPISVRLLNDIHKILLTNTASERGGRIIPGELKKDQNWIGSKLIETARFVPPPPQESIRAMGDLEKFIHDAHDTTPLLIKLALVHYQFETIHPYPDGNGRLGRLLLALLLCEKKAITHPLLYISPYFEKNYDEYIDLMLFVSQRGEWQQWISFFLHGIIQSCDVSIQKIEKLQNLRLAYLNMVQLPRSPGLLSKLIDLLFERPVISAPYVVERLHVKFNTAKKFILQLIKLKILEEYKTDKNL